MFVYEENIPVYVMQYILWILFNYFLLLIYIRVWTL